MKSKITEDTLLVIENGKVIHVSRKKEYQHLFKNTKIDVGDPNLVHKLVSLMGIYAKKVGKTHEEIKNIVLKKYNISSRKQLNNDELENLIKSYQLGLQE